MADGTQQDGGLQALLESIGQGVSGAARKIGHHWFPGLVDAQPPQAPQPVVDPRQNWRNGVAPDIPRPQIEFPRNFNELPASEKQRWYLKQDIAEQQAFKKHAKVFPELYATGYRYNENPDYKDPSNPAVKSPVESLPKYFPIQDMAPYLDIYKQFKGKFGLPKLTEKNLLSMLLAEGRSDFGYNSYDKDQDYLNDIYNQVKSANPNITDAQAGFIAALREKHDVAKRLGISFDEAWNGRGVSGVGRTGKQHAERVKNTIDYAVPHKQNEKIRKLLADRIAMLRMMGIEPTAENMRLDETVLAAKGGSIGKPLPGGSKMI